MHIKIIELKACPNYRQNSECHRDVIHIKISSRALQFLLQFVFRNSLSHHMVSTNIIILLFSPETNGKKRFHYIWIPL